MQSHDSNQKYIQEVYLKDKIMALISDGSSYFRNFVIEESSTPDNSFDCGDICHSSVRRGREMLRSRALQEGGTGSCSREGEHVISPMVRQSCCCI